MTSAPALGTHVKWRVTFVRSKLRQMGFCAMEIKPSYLLNLLVQEVQPLAQCRLNKLS